MDAVTKEKIAEFICGDGATNGSAKYPVYRSSTHLTKFFQDIGINVIHDGSTRKWWVLSVLNTLNPSDFVKVTLRLASPKLYGGDRNHIQIALSTLNEILAVEGFKVILNGIEPHMIRAKANYDFSEKTKEERELRPLPPPDFDKLNLEYGISQILKKRWDEIQKCIDNKATLSAVIMMGSLLEGFLLGIMQRKPQLANVAQNSPRRDDKVKHFAEWSLNDMIEVAHEIGWIQLDVKKFSHALREFRNIIHPYQQLALNTYPDIDTCKISWLVVQAACNDIADWIKQNPN